MNPWEFRLWQQISFWCVWHIDMFHYQRGIRTNQSINQRGFIVDAISISDFSVTSQYLMEWYFTIFLTLYVVRNDAFAVSQYQPRLGQCQNRDREILIPPGFLLAWMKTSGRWCKVKIKSGAMSSLPKVDCDSRTNAVSRGWKVEKGGESFQNKFVVSILWTWRTWKPKHRFCRDEDCTKCWTLSQNIFLTYLTKLFESWPI